jgi:hypothetical protein
MSTTPLANALRLVSEAFERLGITYLIGGSVASSSRGIVRATMYLDLVARIEPGDAQELSAALGPDWYADAAQIRDSILAGRSFNVIHIPTSQKVDIFPATGAFQLLQLQRATKETLDFLGETGEYPVATAEDILLAKLQWYRDGGEISDRQWADITGIVEANSTLDNPYLEAWALRLGVSRLLARALAHPL